MSDSRYPITDVPGSLRFGRRVVFAETDAAGIVHFSNFFRYFEDAEHRLWREAGLNIHSETATLGWPRVAASCEYHRPLRFDQEFEIAIVIADVTSRAIRYNGFIVSNGERVATATWKIACVSKLPDGGMKSTNIPSEIAERLAPYVHRTSDAQRTPTSHRSDTP